VAAIPPPIQILPLTPTQPNFPVALAGQ